MRQLQTWEQARPEGVERDFDPFPGTLYSSKATFCDQPFGKFSRSKTKKSCALLSSVSVSVLEAMANVEAQNFLVISYVSHEKRPG